jgi:hypothetical protein
VHGLLERPVDSGRHIAIVVEGGSVAQFSLLSFRPGPGDLRTIGQPAGEHLVCDDPKREYIGTRRSAFAEKIFGRRVLRRS